MQLWRGRRGARTFVSVRIASSVPGPLATMALLTTLKRVKSIIRRKAMRPWSSGLFFSSSRYLPWKACFIEAHQSLTAVGCSGLRNVPNSHLEVSMCSSACTKWLARGRAIGLRGKGSGSGTGTYGSSVEKLGSWLAYSGEGDCGSVHQALGTCLVRDLLGVPIAVRRRQEGLPH